MDKNSSLQIFSISETLASINSVKDMKKQLDNTPTLSDVRYPLDNAVLEYRNYLKNYQKSSSFTENYITSPDYRTSLTEKTVLSLDKIGNKVFDDREKKISQILFCLKLLSRAKTYEERRIAGLRFLGKKSYSEIATHFTASNRQAIDMGEKKHPTEKSIRRQLNNFLQTVDLTDDGRLSYPNDVFDRLMLVPTKRELKDINDFLFACSSSSIGSNDSFKQYCKKYETVSKEFIKTNFEAEEVFSFLFDIDCMDFSESMNDLFESAEEIIKSCCDYYRCYSHYLDRDGAEDILREKIIHKKSNYEIAHDLSEPLRTVDRTIADIRMILNWDFIAEDPSVEGLIVTIKRLFNSIRETPYWSENKDYFQGIFQSFSHNYDTRLDEEFFRLEKNAG